MTNPKRRQRVTKQSNSMDKSEFETLDHKPKQPICEQCQQENCQCRTVLLKKDIPKNVHLYGNCPEQPNTNSMIFEQVDGAIKVVLRLLEQLEVKNTYEKTQKYGCIWTLKGWQDNNLKHLQKAFE